MASGTDKPKAPTWVDLDAAAEDLDISRRTLRRYISSGKLPAYRVGGGRLLRVKRSDVEALMRPVPTCTSGALS